MGEFPNKATQFQSGKKQVEIAKKGGTVKSERKRIANKISALKRWGMTSKAIEKVGLLLQDAEMSTSDYYKHIERIEEAADPNDVESAKLLMDYKERWHKMAHGDKSKQSMVNIQVNIDTDKKESIIKRLINE
jgi:hypothetical protein